MNTIKHKALFDEGKYDEAIAAFRAMDGYKDSEEQISNCVTAIKEERYNNAIELFNSGKYEEARAAFKALEGYRDSAERIAACDTAPLDQEYSKAMQLYADGLYDEAVTVFQLLNGYKDSDEQISKCEEAIKEQQYNEAIQLGNEGKYADAINMLKTLGDYKDSKEQITALVSVQKEQKYSDALQLLTDGKYEKAIEAFVALGDYKDCKDRIYETALKEYNANMIIEAYDNLISLNGYRDSTEKANAMYGKYKLEKCKNAGTGDVIYLGSYEQDNNRTNGKEDISWIVLSKTNDSLLLISERLIDCMPYNKTTKSVTWEKCSLRKWLNETFYNGAFSSYEKSMILKTNVPIDNNPDYNTPYGKVTTDKLFLLGYNEAKETGILSNVDRIGGVIAIPTPYADAKAKESVFGHGRGWWLRTPGCTSREAIVLDDLMGNVTDGHLVEFYYGVRPAMWIKIKP